MNLSDVLDLSRTYDERKHDHIANASALCFDGRGLVIPPTMFGAVPPLRVTDWALSQLAVKLGPTVFGRGSYKSLPTDYLRAIPSDLFQMVMNRHLSDTNKEWMIRGYEDTARAVLDSRYPKVDNTLLVEAVHGVVSSENIPDFKLVRPSITPDYLNLKMIWKDVGGTNYAIGTYLGNNEIGGGRIRLLPFIQRHSCTNSTIFDNDQALQLVHRGSKTSIMIQLKAAIGQMFEVAADMLDAMLAAEAEELPKFEDIIQGLAKKHGWKDELTNAVFQGTENQRTRAGIVYGLSWAAHTAIEDPNEQVEMEILAGSMLVAPDSVFNRMAKLASEE